MALPEFCRIECPNQYENTCELPTPGTILRLKVERGLAHIRSGIVANGVILAGAGLEYVPKYVDDIQPKIDAQRLVVEICIADHQDL